MRVSERQRVLNLVDKRLIIVGPPGSKRKEIALSLGEYLSEEGEN
jgi:hypothetical protein